MNISKYAKNNASTSGFVELVCLAGLSAMGVITFQNTKAIQRIDTTQQRQEQRIVELYDASNETRQVVNRHEQALQKLGPTADWMQDFK